MDKKSGATERGQQKILVINPGGTSTKIAVFTEKTQIIKQNIAHRQQDLEPFQRVTDQLDYRKQLILDSLAEHSFDPQELTAVAGRGGLMKPIPGGTYQVNQAMLEDLKQAIQGEHASNLGAILAENIGALYHIPAYVVDPVSVDEFQDISRISGIRDLPRASWLHSLNHKAVCRKIADKIGKKYQDCNFIVAHLGSGNSVVAHYQGKMIDGSGGRTDGPFSPERGGGLPTYPLIKLCYSGKYTEAEMVNKVSNVGGFYDYLGTKDMLLIEQRVEAGEAEAKLIFGAYVYQIAKEIAMYGASLYGKVDRIILTGGIAQSDKVVQAVRTRVEYLAPIEVVGGEMEMQALAQGVLRVLNQEEEVKQYQ